MLAGFSVPGVAVVDEPIAAFGVGDEDEDVVRSGRYHAGGGQRARESPEPIRGEVEFGDDFVEEVEGGLATAEGVGAAARARAEDFSRGR
jgi:hypothetical protein